MKPRELRPRNWPWPRIAMLAVIALGMWGLKRHYATAEVGELAWILKPVASLSAFASGVAFEWEAGSGYLSRERLFLIAKPCAGVNFMLAAFGMVGFLLSKHARTWRASAELLAASVAVGFAATVLANALRIVVALWLADHSVGGGWWTAARIHRLEGVTVYFGVLVALHLIVQRVAEQRTPDTMTRTLRRASLPLVFYYVVTVLVPLANGAGNASSAFLEHMAFVLLAPPGLALVFALLRQLGRFTSVSAQRSHLGD